MDRLIREMSYLFTKQRFLELQETAKDIAIGHSDFPECFGLIAEAIAEFVEDTPDDEWREHEKILMHYVAMRVLTLWGNGEKVTDVQWAHPGWFGTAEKGETIQ
ncbi:hypothetical protein ACT2X3_000758 [Enterobacter hormaechei]|uniref:hypothetical protein n=1 Tax=Enterobacter hormaechei TaxID=158836 RepID=UPI0005EF15A5|nr:hypothetical protein [Enterobacter hormaechei]HED3862001.1 hypothetical protein [Enterobacter hormaechei subsp. hoffmannii]HEM8621078.1 hypothetical protein [Citrobacter amalonaticus]KJN01187.1 hypothetical protein SS29_21785 [Enterobacter hormaechei subsp. steigerwaltii]KJN15479.1 hypothetical protein SS18_23620 [Enterobacter hormaechei subsp. steigerwaltii]KTJ54396.1 hypothetical protein ASU82_20530 [Enterobacter hormaechei subsp. xiangfangensis]